MKLFVLFFLLVLAMPASAAAQDINWHAGGGIHLAGFSGVANRTLINPVFGWHMAGGARFPNWGAGLHIEQDLWVENEADLNTVQGALNIGVFGDYLFADGFVRTRMTVGPSILLFTTPLDEAGQVGLYFDIKPAGLRWEPAENLFLVLDPLTFSIVAPVLATIPLIQVEYRTVFSVEFGL